MPDIALANLHHIALTVTDLEASIRWYERVFGIGYRMEEAHEGGVGKLLADEQMRLIIVLHRHDANPGDRFSERRTGLDHVGFGVASRSELEQWESRLNDLGIAHGGIVDAPYGTGLSFRDPDNNALEFFAPPG